MIVTSTNIGIRKEILWNNKLVSTGIFKNPTSEGIFLDKTDVRNDAVIDRKYHGGIDKACYAFSENNYSKWQELYPELTLNPGMFGENLTIKELKESELFIGDIFQIGEAIIQVSEPRQPCFKLNLRFNSNIAVKQFFNFGDSGVYFRVIKPGLVMPNDTLILTESSQFKHSISAVFKAVYEKPNELLLQEFISNPQLSESIKIDLKKKWQIS